jgi:hypothetical protein
LQFEIELREDDREIPERIRKTFFRKYPLQAKKRIAFEIFCKAVELKSAGLHLTKNGIEEFERLQKIMRQSGKKWLGNR